MAFLERATQNARAQSRTTPGSPNLSKNTVGPGTSLGTVQPSRPAVSPASPGVNAAPPGRPPAPPTAAPAAGGAPYPSPPDLVKPSPVSPVLGAPPSAPQAPALTPGTPAAPLVAPPPRQFTGMPKARDLDNLQPGEQAMSPWGPVTLDPSGQPRVQFTPEGEVAYRKAVVTARKKFGPYVGSNDPAAPQPPIQPGQENFNPKTGQWVSL